jgi:predicted DNA-binding protein YlxM (UPF0122 family)
MTANRRERVPEPEGCDKCQNKICLHPGPKQGQPCDLVENWLKAQEKGSSIPWDSDTVVLCGDESYMDHLVQGRVGDVSPMDLDYYGIKSLDEFCLTAKQREAINMFFFQSKRVSQVAKELGISSEAVLERIESAKKRIKKQINRRIIFKEYLYGVLISDIFSGSGIKNSMLAKDIIEAYFIKGLPAAKVPDIIYEEKSIKTTLGVVYKYVKRVEAFVMGKILLVEDRVKFDEHIKTLTDIYY